MAYVLSQINKSFQYYMVEYSGKFFVKSHIFHDFFRARVLGHSACGNHSKIIVFFSEFQFSDPRSEHLPLISSPWPIIGLVSLYLYFVLSLGPRWMEKHSPFQIKTVLIVYNSFQIVSNLLVWYYVSVVFFLICFPFHS